MGRKYAVDLFFDVLSPYSWIAFEALTRYRSVWPIDLHLRPFYFAGVIKATGNFTTPLLLAPKREMMFKDMERNSKYWNIQLKIPHDFSKTATSKTTANAQRLLIALQLHDSALVEPVARAMWQRLFTHSQGIFEKNELEEILKLKTTNGVLFLNMVDSDEVKIKLRKNTDEALANGCFGAPWIHVHMGDGRIEPFFGSDRLPLIANLIGEEYKGPLTELAKF